jgi:hypothetical protein
MDGRKALARTRRLNQPNTSARCNLLEQGLQLWQLERLDQVVIEACFDSPAFIFFLSPSGLCDQQCVGKRGIRAQFPAKVVTILAGQSYVEQDYIGLEFQCLLYQLAPIIENVRFMA